MGGADNVLKRLIYSNTLIEQSLIDELSNVIIKFVMNFYCSKSFNCSYYLSKIGADLFALFFQLTNLQHYNCQSVLLCAYIQLANCMCIVSLLVKELQNSIKSSEMAQNTLLITKV